MANKRRRKSKQRRRPRHSGLYMVLSAVLILAAVALACAVFFRVGSITVQGNSRYTAQEIIDVSGIKNGDNLFLLRPSSVSNQLRRNLPYIQDVTVRRVLPDAISITVTEGRAAAAIACEGQWWLIGQDCKLLERSAATGGLPVVTGIDPLVPAEGTYLAAGEDQRGRVEWLRELLAALGENGLLDKLGGVDLTEDYRITFVYDSRFTVHIPPVTEMGMDYWLRRFAAAVTDPRVDVNQNYTVEIMDEESLRFIPN